MSHKQVLIAVALCIAAMWMISGAAFAQNPPTDQTPPEIMSITNQYIQYVIGVSGQITDSQNNSRDVTGRFGVVSEKGDPDNPADDGQDILADSSLPILNAMVVWINKGNHDILQGSGQWTKPPTVYSQPAAGQQKGVTGPYLEAIWLTNASAGAVAVEAHLIVHLVRDQVRMEITLTNKGATSQNVGFSMLTLPLTGQDVGVTFPFISGMGQVLASGSGEQFYGRVFKGLSVPSIVECFDSVMDPSIATRYTLGQQDCTPPDYFALADNSVVNLTNAQVSDPAGVNYYVPDPMNPITSLVVIEEWAQKALAPGASRKIVTYYGIGAASAAWTHTSGTKVTRDHVVLAVQGLPSVKYDTLNSTGLAQDTFKIKAYIYNLDTDPGPYDLKDVSAYLFLPKGLELDPSSSAQQQIGPVPINSEAAPVEWTVRATGDYVGELQYYVTARDTSGWQQIVSRKIMVPAVKHTVVTGGFQMVSVPFTANSPSLEHMFGWASGDFFAKYYDPSGLGSYQSVTEVVPGQGFWLAYGRLATGATMNVDLADDTQINGANTGHQLDLIQLKLSQGWNMIGNPYVYPIYLGQLMVYNNTTNTTVNFDDAVAYNWISRTIFQWNSSKGAYEYLKGNDAYLLPWKGYWVRASVPVVLMFRPAAWPGSGVVTQPGGF